MEASWAHMTSWPTITEYGVTYDIPNLLSTLKHHTQWTLIKAWLLTTIDTRLNQLGIGFSLPNELLPAKWTLDRVTQLLAMATISQLTDMRVYIDYMAA